MPSDRPVVLLHGLPTSGAIWGPLRRELGGDVYAPDLPGWGRSGEAGLDTVEAHVDWLLAWLAARGVDRPHLVGLDYGGVLAATLADRLPTPPTSLTLTSTALGWAWLPAQITALPPLHRWFYDRHEGRTWLAMGVSAGARSRLLAEVEPELRAHPGLGDHMRRIALGMRLREQRRLAGRLRVPTLCLWGADDVSVPPAVGRRLARRIPGARFEGIPGGRHYVAWERPEAYAGALRRGWEERA